MKTILPLALLLLHPLFLPGQDATTSRSVTGREQAVRAAVIINQVDTSAYPKVAIFATVLKDGSPLRGLTAADFKVREDEVEQEPLTVVPKLAPLSAVVTLDTSGSMKKRMPEAQAAATAFIDSLNAQDRVQVIAFSREVKLLAAATTDRAAARASVAATVARGDTALYDALYASVASLQNTAGRKAITLLSDGADDDGTGRPLSKKTLADVMALARAVNVPIFTVGIGDVDRAVMEKVAQESGGECLIAPDPAALKKLYARISEQLAGQYHIYYTSNLPGDGSTHRVQLQHDGITGTKEYKAPVVVAQASPVAPPPKPEPALVAKETSLYGEAIRGGNSHDSAVELKPGKLFHLDHHQRKDEYDYFFVNLKSGQKVVATINTTQAGVTINGDKATPNNSPYAGIAIHDTKRAAIAHEDVIGAKAGTTSIRAWVGDGQDGKYFVLVGNSYEPQNLESNFRIEVIDQYDGQSDRDAGSTETTALEIAPGVFPANHLVARIDEADTYKFKAKAGVAYQIKVRPGEDVEMKVEAIDADGVSLGKAISPNAGALAKIEKFSVKEAGFIYVRVTGDYFSNHPELIYALAIGENTVESPSRPAVAP